MAFNKLIGTAPNQIPTNGDLGTLAFQDAASAIVENLKVTKSLDVPAGNIAANTLSVASTITSSVATGTAPFTVASTTAVTNLNADKVDGKDFGTFAQGGIVYASSTTAAASTAAGTVGQVLQSNGTAAPTWVTLTSSGTGAVAANATITAGTATKITYDEKGLVTAGASLVASDIPSLDASKIASGTLSDSRLPTRLGTTAKTITDWNTATENGWYMANAATNAPDATNWFTGLVEVHNANWITQTVHAFSSNTSQDTVTYRRENNNGTWTDWFRLRLSQEEQSAIYLNASNLNAGTVPNARMPAFSGDVTSTAGSTALTLANSGVTAGTYKSVTVDAKGRVTAGTNPTTITGYGITDAYTKTEIDGFLQGLKAKQSVKVATTANITLSGTQTIDGVAVVANDRVLVKNQTTGSQNGIYVVAASAWTRSTDANTAAELTAAYVFVEQGTANKDTSWVQTVDSITVDTTALTWVQFSGSGAYAPTIHAHGTYDRATSALSGASVFSDIVVADGIVTSTTTRSLTASDVGAAASSHTHNYLPLTGGDLTGNISIKTAGNSAIELGRVDGTASTPFVNFHSGAIATDYDFRFIASGGDGTAGNGKLDYYGLLSGIKSVGGSNFIPLHLQNSSGTANSSVTLDLNPTSADVGQRSCQITAVTNGSNQTSLEFKTANANVPATRATLTADGFWNVTGGVSAPILTSTVATGTAPLTVTSTTVVTNLNADNVDGKGFGTFSAAGGILYATSTSAASGTAAGTAGQVLKSGGASAPTWATLEMTDIPDAAFKKSVKAATTAALTVTATSTTLTNSGTLAALALDGVTLAVNDRVLVKDQATAAQNGIYTVTTVGSASVAWVLTRSADANSSSEVAGAVVNVDSGTTHGGVLFTSNFKSTDTIGTTAMNWYSVVDSSLLATAGNSIVGAIKYNSTTKTSGQFYGGTTAPSNTTRLNYDGNLYATNFYGNGSTLSNVLPLSGGTLTGGLSITTTGNASIELGRVDGTASTPFIDFHSGATAIDYDARIIASGGTGTAGKGALTVTADGGITFTGTVTAPALVVGGSYISPGRLFFYSNM